MQSVAPLTSRKEVVSRTLAACIRFKERSREFIGRPGSSPLLEIVAITGAQIPQPPEPPKFGNASGCARIVSNGTEVRRTFEISCEILELGSLLVKNLLRYIDDTHHDRRQDFRETLGGLTIMLLKAQKIVYFPQEAARSLQSSPDFFFQLLKQLDLTILFLKVSEILHENDRPISRETPLGESISTLSACARRLKSLADENQEGCEPLSEKTKASLKDIKDQVFGALRKYLLWCQATGTKIEASCDTICSEVLLSDIISKDQILVSDVQKIRELANNLEKASKDLQTSRDPRPTTTDFSGFADASPGNGIG